MTELRIEEKNILPLLGLDGLPVHIRRTTDYVEPEFIDTCYVECFGHVLAVYHVRDGKCYVKALYRLRIHKGGVTATQVLCFSGFEADTAMGYHPAEPAYRARLLKRLNGGIAKFKSLAHLSVAVASYAHVGISQDWRQWHVIRNCVAGRFCMAVRTIKQVAGNPLEDSLKKVNFRLDRIESRLAVGSSHGVRYVE